MLQYIKNIYSSKAFKYVVLSLFILGIINAGIWIFTKRPDLFQNNDKIRIELLEYKIDSLKKNDIKYDIRINKIKDSISILDDNIKTKNNNTQIINRYYYEKIGNVDKFNADSIHKFIADRYK